MAALKNAAALRREFTAAQRIPYRAHVASGVIRTEFGDYLQAFRLGGASFETSDDAQLNNWHERLNVLWRNIAGPGVALWAHVIRRRASIADAESERRAVTRGDGGFAGELQRRYRRRLREETLMLNELYLAVLYRPVAGKADRAVVARNRQDANKMRPEPSSSTPSMPATSSPRRSVHPWRDMSRRPWAVTGTAASGAPHSSSTWLCSSTASAVAWRCPADRSINVWLACGSSSGPKRSSIGRPVRRVSPPSLESRNIRRPQLAGMYDRLLSAPMPFVLTQSFTFLSKASGQALLQRQFNRMANAGDFAVSQAAELKDALDALTSNEFVMGDHHFSLQIISEVADSGKLVPGVARLKALNDRVALARSFLADTGMLVAREDLALEAAFWAQLPGNFPFRPRKAPITSRNLAAMAPFHNYPLGRADGNHWGEALALLITSARSPYHFSLHASDPSDPDGGSRKDTGHTLICGPTGSGKTVLIGFLIALLARRDTTQVIFDKDRGLEILVRALGGEYFPLKSGISTGFNPLQLPVTPSNVEFLKMWLAELAGFATRAAVRRTREQADLDQALRGTLALEVSARRLSRLIEFLDPTDPEGLHARLARWCEVSRGDYAWVFDNPVDSLAARLQGQSIIGFDVTEFLDHAQTRPAITLYLFHLVRQLLDGRRLVCWMDEFWRLLSDPAFESFAKDGPKTWRKLNAVMCLATQSPSDVLQSPISRTLVEQTPTKVFFPNSDASHAEYTEGFGLTEREFRLIKEEIEPGSRMFLVKQSHHSVVCQLDLKGFDAELAVISGRATEVVRMNELMATLGPDPVAWLPPFLAANTKGARPLSESVHTQ